MTFCTTVEMTWMLFQSVKLEKSSTDIKLSIVSSWKVFQVKKGIKSEKNTLINRCF